MYANKNRKLPLPLRIEHQKKHIVPKFRSASGMIEERRPDNERARGISATSALNLPPRAQSRGSASKFALSRDLHSPSSSAPEAAAVSQGSKMFHRKKYAPVPASQLSNMEDGDSTTNDDEDVSPVAMHMPHHVHPIDMMDQVLIMPGYEGYERVESEYQTHARHTTRSVYSSRGGLRPMFAKKSENQNYFHTPLGSEFFDDDAKGPKRSIYGSTYPPNYDVTRPPLPGTYPQQDHKVVGSAGLWNKLAPDSLVYQSSYRAKFNSGAVPLHDDTEMARQRAAMTKDPYVLGSRKKFEAKLTSGTRVLRANQESYEREPAPFTCTSEARDSYKQAPKDFQRATPLHDDNPPLVKEPGWEHMEANTTNLESYDGARSVALIGAIKQQRAAGKAQMGSKTKREMVDGVLKLGDNDPKSSKTPLSLSRATYRPYVFV